LSYERWASGQSTAPQDPARCPFAGGTGSDPPGEPPETENEPRAAETLPGICTPHGGRR